MTALCQHKPRCCCQHVVFMDVQFINSPLDIMTHLFSSLFSSPIKTLYHDIQGDQYKTEIDISK